MSKQEFHIRHITELREQLFDHLNYSIGRLTDANFEEQVKIIQACLNFVTGKQFISRAKYKNTFRTLKPKEAK